MKVVRSCLALTADVVDERVKEGVPHVVRLKVPTGSSVIEDDRVFGDVRFAHAVVDDQVLLKSDGFPTY